MSVSLKFTQVWNNYSSYFGDARNQKTALSIALGISFAQKAPVPTASLEEVETYYNEFIRIPAGNKAAEFNESVLVDIDLVTKFTRAFWMMRYFSAYPRNRLPLSTDESGDFMGKYFGFSEYFSETELEFLNKNIKQIILMANDCLKAFEAEAN